MHNLFPYKRYSFNNEELFKGLPDEICELLFTNKVIVYFTVGQTIFKEGSEPKGIYVLKSGKVKKHTATNFGKDHVFYICKEKEVLGYHALLSKETYPDTSTALTNCEVAFIPKEDFLKAIERSHLLSERLLQNLSHEFGVYINSTKMLAKHTVRERTALNLLILNEKFKQNEDDTKIDIDLGRNDLASMVGTAKESLVRMLHEFKEENLITSKGRIIRIIDFEGLVKVSNFK
jgi:CRP-like cAMP-binding protein